MTPRHDFVVVIPVADRPRQLTACLASLARLLERHPYAAAVRVLIVDDSLEPEAVARHRALAAARTRAGLTTDHLDRAAQRALVEALPAPLRARLTGVLGGAGAGGRLGASVARNLASLWLARQPRAGCPRLAWFVDSDERFELEAAAPGAHTVLTPDYLHTLDRLFAERPLEVLTGKVVGDPPVSPAVMATTLLDDILVFLTDLAGRDPHAPCRYHGDAAQADGAAYHDLADLFGYPPTASVAYRCPLAGAHDHAACLAQFAAGLTRFFHGVHPTRGSRFVPGAPLAPTPARTVYTGNYVVTESALAWFIPYASLGLRMAGPTLGRLLKATLGERFASVDLPLMHGRTLAGLGRSECRPGVHDTPQGVDLSEEFERQYYGDVLLFTVEALTALGYPEAPPDEGQIRHTLTTLEARLNARYAAQQRAIAERMQRLLGLLGGAGHWWEKAAFAPARTALLDFLHELRRNFGLEARPWQRLSEPERRAGQLERIAAALARYPDERAAWRAALGRA